MLRKLALIVPALFVNIIMYAQFKKGDKMVGASVGSLFYNNSSSDISYTLGSQSVGTDHFGVIFGPSIGWFVSEDFVIGAAPTINYSKEKQIGKSAGLTYLKNESTRFGVGVGGFGRYYFKGAGKSLLPFGQFDLSFGLSGSKSEGFEYETYGVYVDRYDYKSSGDFFANTGFTLGVSKFLSDKTSLDLYIGYKFSYIKSHTTGNFLRDYTNDNTADETRKPDYDENFTGHNIVLSVGLQIFLDKKK